MISTPLTLKFKVSPALLDDMRRWSREPLFIRMVPKDGRLNINDGDEVEFEFQRPEPK